MRYVVSRAEFIPSGWWEDHPQLRYGYLSLSAVSLCFVLWDCLVLRPLNAFPAYTNCTYYVYFCFYGYLTFLLLVICVLLETNRPFFIMKVITRFMYVLTVPINHCTPFWVLKFARHHKLITPACQRCLKQAASLRLSNSDTAYVQRPFVAQWPLQ